MIQFVYQCDECLIRCESGSVYQMFGTFSGKPYGFGRYTVHADPIIDKPAGWIVFDPVGATYCAECAEKLRAAS